ncbi:MAG TPA: MFS transporter [Xanthobacteraceae bacterium]|nr:MFS transporter [Xanthobacteraceae bacterium]
MLIAALSTPLMARNALMLGNLVTGVAVLAPAGMLPELAAGLDASIQQAGLLVTFGAVILCFGSPLLAWATSRMDRRMLLAGTMLVVTIGHAVSALAPDYGTLLGARLLLLAVTAIYTPQAAGTVALLVRPAERSEAIAYIFLGWSLAIAVGLPTIAFVASHFGWRTVYGALTFLGALAFVMNALALPAGLKGMPLSLASWGTIARNRTILLLLAVTGLTVAGQFHLFVYLGPLLTALTGAGVETIALTFAGVGVAGVVGNILTQRGVRRFGTFGMSCMMIGCMMTGLVIWSLGTGLQPIMIAGMVLVGFGTAASNTMQQARLASVAPDLASATIALNTSAIYVGQAVGSALGGIWLQRGMPAMVGYEGTAIMAAAVCVLVLTRPRRA